MQRSDWWAMIAGAVLVVVITGGAIAFSPAPLASNTSASAPIAPAPPTVYRTLSISFDPGQGTYVYQPLALSVPRGVEVILTITNYDRTVGQVLRSSDAQVSGTMGGSMTVVNGGSIVDLSGLSSTAVSHTFTLSDAFHHVNVPVPAANPSGSPVKVEVALEFTLTGTYFWGCILLCDPGTMADGADQGMDGLLTVS